MIQRDDVDGSVLVSNATLGTAMIDLGHKDKAYVGQKFVVSALDRAGNRVNKGEIMIVKVTGDHSAKTRILAGSAGRGDRIHNPFYQPGETIYVYFAGKMDKWPMEMARDRLAKTNVIVQDAPNGKTHYIILRGKWGLAIDTAVLWLTGYSLQNKQYCLAHGTPYIPCLLLTTTGARTGKRRIRAGVPEGWRVGNKTGTAPRSARAFCDVAFLEPPGGPPSILAVYCDRPTASDAEVSAAIAAVARLCTQRGTTGNDHGPPSAARTPRGR